MTVAACRGLTVWTVACYKTRHDRTNLVTRSLISSVKIFSIIISVSTLIMLTRIWRAPTNASKWRMRFNSAFKGINIESEKYMELDIGRSVYNFLQYIHTFQRDTQCCSTNCLLMHRCQLYMFRTVTVRPQELLFRCCMCRLWYVVRTALSDTSRWYNVWGRACSRMWGVLRFVEQHV